MRDSLEIIEELGVPVRQIRASGGGSRSPLVAADPGRRVRPQGGHHQQRGRGGLRRGPAGGGGRGRSTTSARPAPPRSAWSRKRCPKTARRHYDRAFPVYQQLYRSLKTISSGSRRWNGEPRGRYRPVGSFDGSPAIHRRGDGRADRRLRLIGTVETAHPFSTVPTGPITGKWSAARPGRLPKYTRIMI